MIDPAAFRQKVEDVLFRAADDGRLVEHWAVRDDVGLMMQAGLLGPPGGG